MWFFPISIGYTHRLTGPGWRSKLAEVEVDRVGKPLLASKPAAANPDHPVPVVDTLCGITPPPRNSAGAENPGFAGGQFRVGWVVNLLWNGQPCSRPV